MISAKTIDAAILNKTPDMDIIISRLNSWQKMRLNGICIPSSYSSISKIRIKLEEIMYDDIEIIPVIGYPNGDTTIASKVTEIVDNYNISTSLDVVLNATYMRIGAWDMVRREIIEILMNSSSDIRWIIETPILTSHEITEVCGIILDHSGHIKTATGTKGNTEVADVRFIKSIIGNKRMIKASGGISTPQIAEQMIDAGANIIGTSNPEGLLSINL